MVDLKLKKLSLELLSFLAQVRQISITSAPEIQDLVTDELRIALSTNILESLLSSISQPQEQCTIFSTIIRCNTQTLS